MDFPRFFTTHDKNAVFPMSADTFCGLPDLPSVARTSKYGSCFLSSLMVATSVDSFVLKRPETFNTSEKNEKHSYNN